MALVAGGADPHAVKKQGASPMDFLASQANNWRSVTDYERTILAVAAAGEDPRAFAGMDLVAKVRSFQKGEGNVGDAVNSNAFGILAYKAAGEEIPPGAVQWQKRTQNPDGGWGNSPGAASNPDMTAASIMALKAAGVENGDQALVSALAYLHAAQNADGGFSFQSAASDVSATAWCAQAISAVGQDPASGEWSRGGNTPISFLNSMQAGDGRFVWMKGREMNPVWTTAYAVCALAGRPYPIGICRTRSSEAVNSGQNATGSGNEGNPTAADPESAENAPTSGDNKAEEGAVSSEQGTGFANENAVPEFQVTESAAEAEEGRSSEAGGFPVFPLLATLIPAALALALAGYFLRRRLLQGKEGA
jgi:hypothetical protein